MLGMSQIWVFFTTVSVFYHIRWKMLLFCTWFYMQITCTVHYKICWKVINRKCAVRLVWTRLVKAISFIMKWILYLEKITKGFYNNFACLVWSFLGIITISNMQLFAKQTYSMLNFHNKPHIFFKNVLHKLYIAYYGLLTYLSFVGNNNTNK